MRLTQGRRGYVPHAFLASALSACLLVVAVVSAPISTMLLPGLFAVLRQSPAALVALGVTAMGQAGLTFAGFIELSGWTASSAMTVPSPPRSGTLLAWLVIGILGVAALLLGVARARAAPESRRVGIALTAGALGALGLLAWLAVAVSAVPGPVAARLHDAVRATAERRPRALGLRGGASPGPAPARRGAAVALAILGAMPVLVGSTWFADRFGGDPLRVSNRSLASEGRDGIVAGQIQLDQIAAELRVSPLASRFALQPWMGREEEDDTDDPEPVRAPMLVGGFSGTPRPIEGNDLGFLDEERALVLISTSETAELKILNVTAPSSTLGRVVLPPVANPRLSVDASAGTWTVSGVDRQWSHAIGLAGRVGEEPSRSADGPCRAPTAPCSLRAASPMLPAATRPSCRRSACPAHRPGSPDPAWLLLPLSLTQWSSGGSGTEGPRRLAASRGPFSCLPTPIDQATVLCWSVQRGATLLGESPRSEPRRRAAGFAALLGAISRSARTGAWHS